MPYGVSSKSWIGLARELTTGTPLLPTSTIPVARDDYSPEDTPKFLDDVAVRGAMAELYNKIQGVQIAAFSYGGPAFLDVEGLWLDNILGDMTSTINGGSQGLAQALSAPITAGATALTVGTSLGAVTTGSLIQITDTATGNEIVTASAGSSGTAVNFTGTPARFAHAAPATAALITSTTGANYTHRWSLLNSGTGQPPTHTVTDNTNITAAGARWYPSACLASLDFTGNAEQLLMMKVTGNSWLSSAISGTPVNTTAFVRPQPNWRSTVSVGGTQVPSVGEWTCNIKRVLQPYWTAANTQTPQVIARGGLSVSYGLNFTVPQDESPLTNMLTAGYLAVQISISNGLTGASALSLVITSTAAQTVKAKPTRNAVVVGYDDQLDAVANATDAGGSLGLSPISVSLTNAIANY